MNKRQVAILICAVALVFINWSDFQNVDLTATPKYGEILIKMHRRTTGTAEAPSINITVAGDYGTGTFSTTETLTINCL